nr:PREDICTED: prostaglandin E synthase 2 [Bemisia tabaci]
MAFYRAVRSVIQKSIRGGDSGLTAHPKRIIFDRFCGYSTAFKDPKPKTSWKSVIGYSAAFGTLIGGYYAYYKAPDPAPVPNKAESTYEILPTLPDVPASKKIEVPGHETGPKVILFQYPTCPFCCKVRAFLDFYGVSYDIVEVNPVLRQQIKWSKYKKVPIILVQVDGGYQQLNDSSMIISALRTLMLDKNANLSDIVNFYPSIKFKDLDGKVKSDVMNKYFVMNHKNKKDSDNDIDAEERKWRQWADEVLVHTLSPNVYRSKDEALQAFNWFSEAGEWEKNFSTWERYLIIYVGAFVMYFIGKSLKKKHALKDDVRESLYDECKYYVNNIRKQGTKFIGGNVPNLGDLAVYGVLSSIEGCDAFKDLMNNSSSVEQWYQDMKIAVNNHLGMNQATASLTRS